MEHKIGEIFNLNGVKLKVEKTDNKSNRRCQGCYLNTRDFECLANKAGACDSKFRIDKTDVIFKKVK